MSSLTPRLSLKRPDGADPFLRQDFVDNWNKLDAAPGVHICTSSSRPSWGAAHAGREIVETDTLRRLAWTGTAWAEPRVAAGQWGFSSAPLVYQNSGTTGTWTMGTINMLRPAQILTITTVRAASKPNASQNVTLTTLVDDVDRTLGSFTGYCQWADLSSGTVVYDHRTTTFMAQANLAKGSHTIKTRAVVSTASSNNVYIGSISTAVLIVAGNGGADTV